MSSLKSLLMILVLATLAACSTESFPPGSSAQAYHDYVAGLQMNPDVINDSRGW